MPGGEIAKLFIEIGAKVDQATSALQQVKSELAEVEGQARGVVGAVEGHITAVRQRLSGIAESFGLIGGAMTAGFTLPVVGAVKEAVGAFTDFQSNLNYLQAVTGATAPQMEQLAALARQLGNDTELPAASAANAAEAMVELGKAGLSVNDILSGTKGVLELAAAGGLSTAEAASIAANALNAFGLSGKDVTSVADMLAAAANASTADVRDLAYGFQSASAVFHQFGYSAADLTTALALMSNAGIQGQDAGTSLKQMLLSLLTPSKQAADELRRLGVHVTDASGHFVGFRDLIAQFQAGLSKLPPAEREMALATIFGSDAVRAANVILGEGVEKWDEMYGAVTKAGAAHELAAARMKGIGGALAQLKSQITTLAIDVVSRFAEPIEQAVRKVTEVFAYFDNLSPHAQNMILAFVGVVAATGPFLVAIGAVAGALAFLLTPVGALAVGLGLLAAAFAGNVGGIRELASSLLPQLVAGFTQLVSALAPIGSQILSTLQAIGQDAVAALSVVGSVLSTQFTAMLTAIVPHLQGIVAQVTVILGTLGQAIQPIFITIIQMASLFVVTMGSVLMSLVPVVLQGVQTVLQGIQIFVGALVPTIVGVVHAFVPVVREGIAELAGVVMALVSTVVPMVTQLASQLMGALAPLLPHFVTLAQGIAAFLVPALRLFGDIIVSIVLPAVMRIGEQLAGHLVPVVQQAVAVLGPALDQLGGAFQRAATFIQQHLTDIEAIVKGAFDLIEGTIKVAIDVITGVLTILIDLLHGDFAKAWEDAKTTVSNVWNDIKTAVSQAVDDTKATMQKIADWLAGEFQTAWNNAKTLVSGAWTDIKTAISTGVDDAKTKMGEIVSWLGGEFQTAWNGAKTFLAGAWTEIKTTISTGVQDAVTALKGIETDIKNVFTGAAGWLVQAGKDIISGLINGITSQVTAAAQAAANAAKAALSAAKSALGIHSPSTEFQYVGEMAMAGVIVGMQETAPAVTATAVGIVTSAQQQALAAAQVQWSAAAQQLAKSVGMSPDQLEALAPSAAARARSASDALIVALNTPVTNLDQAMKIFQQLPTDYDKKAFVTHLENLGLLPYNPYDISFGKNGPPGLANVQTPTFDFSFLSSLSPQQREFFLALEPPDVAAQQRAELQQVNVNVTVQGHVIGVQDLGNELVRQLQLQGVRP